MDGIKGLREVQFHENCLSFGIGNFMQHFPRRDERLGYVSIPDKRCLLRREYL